MSSKMVTEITQDLMAFRMLLNLNMCAGYRGMPRQGQAYGRRPDVSNKPAEAWVGTSRYSVQSLICFIEYIFKILTSPWMGAIKTLQSRTVVFLHYHHNKMWPLNRHSNLPVSLYAHTLNWYHRTLLVKLTNKIDNIHIRIKIINARVEWTGNFHTWVSTSLHPIEYWTFEKITVFGYFKRQIFKHVLIIILRAFLCNCAQVNSTWSKWW